MMKDRKKMAAELHHRKQEGNGTSMIFGRKVPVIKEVYDPLTGLRNGTITPNAPVVIQVKTCVYLHLELFTWGFLPSPIRAH